MVQELGRRVEMANQYLDLVALTGVWGVPDEMHDEFIEFANIHAEFMVEKSQQSGGVRTSPFLVGEKFEDCRSV